MTQSQIKSILLAGIVCLPVLSAHSFAQSVKFVSERVNYTRKNYRDIEYKKNFTAKHLRVKSGIKHSSRQKISTLINYEKAFDISIDEAINGDLYIDELDYRIKYNKNYILDILLVMEASGAYPWTTEKEILINTKTGDRIDAKDVFTPAGLKSLVVRVRKMFTAEIARSIKNGSGENYNFQDAKYHLSNLSNMTVNDKGVTFYYDYEFPFAVLALEPAGRFFFPWRQLKPYIKSGGLFAQFIR